MADGDLTREQQNQMPPGSSGFAARAIKAESALTALTKERDALRDAEAKVLDWAKEQHACADRYAAEIVRLRKALTGWVDWHARATANDDCEYLNGTGWPDSEALASTARAALNKEAK